MSIVLPSSKAELDALVGNQVQESLHLEYKASPALLNRGEISKDVSAFLNSDGGQIIYGIRENRRAPVSIDDGAALEDFNREQLEQIILSNIAPRPSGIAINAIPVSERSFAYAVGIQRSYRGPHQDSITRKYYKRFEFQSVAMQHFEIEDVRSRRALLLPLLSVDVAIHQEILVHVVVENIGEHPAFDVRFEFEPKIEWHRGKVPPLLERGTRFFPPGRKYHFLYGSYLDLMNVENKRATSFSVTVEYRHPLSDTVVREVFHCDLLDFDSASIIRSDVALTGDQIKRAVEDLTRKMDLLTSAVESTSTIAGATGLTLSLPTIRNLQAIATGALNEEHLDHRDWTPGALQEALGIDRDTARLVWTHTRRGDASKIGEAPGVSAELATRVRRLFTV
jgi:hypothetical protein